MKNERFDGDQYAPSDESGHAFGGWQTSMAGTAQRHERPNWWRRGCAGRNSLLLTSGIRRRAGWRISRGRPWQFWEIMMVARDYKNDAAKVAKHLRWTEAKVQSAFHYAKAFPDEINEAIAEQRRGGFRGVVAHVAAGKGVRGRRTQRENDPCSGFLLDEHLFARYSGRPCAAPTRTSLFSGSPNGRMDAF